jgi:hypothetical protein
VAVVEAEREAYEVGVHPLPHVHLHRERLPPRDQPAAAHQNRPNEADDDDRNDEEGQRVLVAGAKRAVDHVLRQPDQRDRRCLRSDGEDDRDRERGLVRL